MSLYQFSEAICQFTERLRNHAKDILLREMHLKVKVSRFEYKGYLYPIQIVCFEHPSRLGQFDAEFYEIAIHIDLLFDESTAIDVLKHELAHYIAFLEFGILDHGPKFHAICQKYHFPKEIAAATHRIHPKSQTMKEMEKKVRKLLALSEKSTLHEAKSALLKAESLMQKYGLSLTRSEDDRYAMKRILKQKRSSQKQKSISQMLKFFNVESILHHSKDISCIEIIGLHDHVEIAAYVADFLNQQLEILWKQTKKQHHLHGLRAKNSFFRGIALGYEDQKREKNPSYALVKAHLKKALSLVYPSLSYSKSASLRDSKSESLGKKAGKMLKINLGIHQKHPLYIPFFG